MPRTSQFGLGLLVALALAGCGGGGNGGYKAPAIVSVADWSEILAIPQGTRVTILGDEASGPSTVTAFGHTLVTGERTAIFSHAFDENGQKQFSLTTDSKTLVGSGDSGCPVLKDGKLIGVIFSGWEAQSFYAADPNGLMAMYDEYKASNRAVKPVDRRTPVANRLIPWFVEGLGSSRLEQVQRHLSSIRLISSDSGGIGRAGRGGPESMTLHSGQRYAGMVLSGDIVRMYFAATVTCPVSTPSTRGGGSGEGAAEYWLATGHAIDAFGVRAIPVWPLQPDFRIQDGLYKGTLIGHAVDGEVGTLVYDGSKGSVIAAYGSPAETSHITVSGNVGGVVRPTIFHYLARDGGSYYEAYGLETALYASISRLLNDLTVARGRAAGTLTLTFASGQIKKVDFAIESQRELAGEVVWMALGEGVGLVGQGDELRSAELNIFIGRGVGA